MFSPSSRFADSTRITPELDRTLDGSPDKTPTAQGRTGEFMRPMAQPARVRMVFIEPAR
jgi:hypothetical protein